MSSNSHIAPQAHPGLDRDRAHSIHTWAEELLPERGESWHHHYRAQLFYASAGVMRVFTANGTWVVPPEQAVWVPSGMPHGVEVLSPLSMRSLYVHPKARSGLPEDCRVFRVTPLLRELILSLVGLLERRDQTDRAERMAAVILDELPVLEPEPLHLPLPREPRVRRVSDALMANPAEGRSLGAWAAVAGASERTLARAFVRETGMTFGAWRQRLRLVTAVARLAEGEPITTLALDLGYDSPSAFIAMFRKALGTSPGRFIAQSRT